VLSGEPFQVTTVPVENPEPLAVRVNAGPPAVAVLGEILVRVSGGGLIVKIAALETWPAVCAVIDAIPGWAIRLAGTVTVSCPEFTTIPNSAELFQNRTVLALNPVPLTVSVKLGPPAVADVGEMLVIVTFGLMVNVSGGGDVRPPSATSTKAVPAVIKKLEGTVAVSCEVEMKLVLSPDPLHVTRVPLLKPDPLAVNVKPADPAVILIGEILLRAKGTCGWVIVNVSPVG
jgi:hypothetical protein